MEWLRPALVFMGLASMVLAATFFYLWLAVDRRRHLLLWSLAWFAAIPHLVLTWGMLDRPDAPTLWTAQQVFLTINALTMAAGCYDFVHRRVSLRVLGVAGLPFIVWALAGPLITTRFFEITLPGSILLGGSYLWTAHRFWILRRRDRTRGAGVVAVLFALAGLHEFDYPLFGDMPAAAPVGYALASLLALAIAMFLLIISLEDAHIRSQQERARVAAILSHLPVGVIVTAPDGHILLANPLARALGADAGTLDGVWNAERASGHLRGVDGSACDPNAHPLAMALATGSTSPPREMILSGAGQAERAVLVHAGPVRDEHGSLVGGVAIYQDIDDLQRMRAEMVRAERLRGLGVIAAGVAHDFNNALTMIMGHAEMAQLRSADPALREQLDVIRRVAADSAAVVRRIQDAARVRATRDPVVFDLGRVVRDVVDLSRPRWRDQAQAQGLDYRMQLAPRDGLTVAGHEAEMREAILNLVLNALDAMPTGGTLFFDLDRDGSFVTLRMRDTGVGMDRDVMAHVFDPFFSTKGTQGTGLGLAIVFGIVQRHEGTISVESQPGQGTTFTLRLPFREPEAAPAPPMRSDAAGLARRILLVEDDAGVRALAERMLVSAGHTVVSVDCGEEAVQRLTEEAPDLVFTDLGMPGMNGWDVAAAVRRLRPDVPVVLITGWGETIAEKELEANGVSRVLAKPFSYQELLACIADVTGGRPAAA